MAGTPHSSPNPFDPNWSFSSTLTGNTSGMTHLGSPAPPQMPESVAKAAAGAAGQSPRPFLSPVPNAKPIYHTQGAATINQYFSGPITSYVSVFSDPGKYSVDINHYKWGDAETESTGQQEATPAQAPHQAPI